MKARQEIVLRGRTYVVVLPKLSSHASEGKCFLLKQLCPLVSVVWLVFFLLGGAVLLSGCICAGGANNELALGLCHLSEQF